MIFFCFYCLWCVVFSLTISGDVSTPNSFKLLANFAFQYSESIDVHADFHILYRKESNLKLVWYYGKSSDFNKFMHDNLDCYYMLNVPKQYHILKMVRNLDVYPITGIDDTGNYIEKRFEYNYNGYSDLVDAFSYFALVNCDYMDSGNGTDLEPINGPIDVKYMNLHITNTVNTCKELRYPYNKSQMLYIIMTVIAAVMVLCGLFEYYKLKQEVRNHWVALIFLVSIISFFIFCLFSMSAYIQSCKDGELDNELMGVAVFFQALHEAFFILHILLLCKGWGLFKHKINIKERMIIGCYFMSYLILIMNSMYWKYFRSEIYDDQNFFITAPGIIYLIVRLLSFFLMHRNLYHTVPNDSLIDNKFILVVYICGIVYIFAPCVGCFISLAVKDFEKYYVVDITNTVISAFIYLVLIIFYFPSHLTKTICPNYFASDPLNPAYQQSYIKDDVTGKIENGFSVLVQLQAKLLQLQKQCVSFNSVIEKTVHELGLDPNTYIAHSNSNPVPTLQYARHEEIMRRGKGGGGGRKQRESSSSFTSDNGKQHPVLLPKGGNKMIINNDVAGSMRGPKDDDSDSDNDNHLTHNRGGKYLTTSRKNKKPGVRPITEEKPGVRAKGNGKPGVRVGDDDDDDDDDDEEEIDLRNNLVNNNNNGGRISHGAPSNKDPFENYNFVRDHSEITTPTSNKHSKNYHSNSTTPNRYYNDRNEQDREYDVSGNRMVRETSRHNDIIPKNSLDDDYHRPRIDSNNKPPPINTSDTRRSRDNHNSNSNKPSSGMNRDNYGNSNNYYENDYTDFNQSPNKRHPRDSGSTKHRGGGGRGGRGGRLEPLNNEYKSDNEDDHEEGHNPLLDALY